MIPSARGARDLRQDSGLRGGTDIVEALAMDAAGVCIGRPYVRGPDAFGESGVERVLELLRIDLRAIMQQLEAPSIKDLKPSMVRRASSLALSRAARADQEK